MMMIGEGVRVEVVEWRKMKWLSRVRKSAGMQKCSDYEGTTCCRVVLCRGEMTWGKVGECTSTISVTLHYVLLSRVQWKKRLALWDKVQGCHDCLLCLVALCCALWCVEEMWWGAVTNHRATVRLWPSRYWSSVLSWICVLLPSSLYSCYRGSEALWEMCGRAPQYLYLMRTH